MQTSQSPMKRNTTISPRDGLASVDSTNDGSRFNAVVDVRAPVRRMSSRGSGVVNSANFDFRHIHVPLSKGSPREALNIFRNVLGML